MGREDRLLIEYRYMIGGMLPGQLRAPWTSSTYMWVILGWMAQVNEDPT